jgi:hypothetical protein
MATGRVNLVDVRSPDEGLRILYAVDLPDVKNHDGSWTEYG